MNLLRLHLWREWREHRMALCMLMLVLPLVALGLSRVPPKQALGDPLLQSGAALACVVIVLVAVGGELLGVERRGPGLRWLERLPSGLSTAFLAKLLFLLLTTTLAALYGFGLARSVAFFRGAESRALRWEPYSFVAGVALVLWTFACSAWALRGGVSIFAAVLVLGVVGYPAWVLVSEGYQLGASEVISALALLVLGGLASAALGFLRGGRFGHGTALATMFGLTPAVLLLLTTSSWTSIHLVEREAFDPLGKDFGLVDQLITSDGHYAFAHGLHFRPDWDPESMPEYTLRIDLRTGAFETLGRHVRCAMRYREDEHGLPCPDEIVVQLEGEPLPLVFDAADGAPRSWSAKSDLGWFSKGLGFYLFQTPGRPAVIRDPFRGRDYPAEEFSRRGGWSRVLVRPGRWLCQSKGEWCWLDPDTKEQTAVDWAPGTKLLALLEDGRILLTDPEHDLIVVHPERGLSYTLDSLGVPSKDIYESFDARRVPDSVRCFVGDESSPLVLRTEREGLLVIDPELTTVRRIALTWEDQLHQRVGPDFITKGMNSGALKRLDLSSGELTTIWPPAKR